MEMILRSWLEPDRLAPPRPKNDGISWARCVLWAWDETALHRQIPRGDNRFAACQRPRSQYAARDVV